MMEYFQFNILIKPQDEDCIEEIEDILDKTVEDLWHVAWDVKLLEYGFGDKKKTINFSAFREPVPCDTSIDLSNFQNIPTNWKDLERNRKKFTKEEVMQMIENLVKDSKKEKRM